jgi:hypothetical protein
VIPLKKKRKRRNKKKEERHPVFVKSETVRKVAEELEANGWRLPTPIINSPPNDRMATIKKQIAKIEAYLEDLH